MRRSGGRKGSANQDRSDQGLPASSSSHDPAISPPPLIATSTIAPPQQPALAVSMPVSTSGPPPWMVHHHAAADQQPFGVTQQPIGTCSSGLGLPAYFNPINPRIAWPPPAAGMVQQPPAWRPVDHSIAVQPQWHIGARAAFMHASVQQMPAVANVVYQQPMTTTYAMDPRMTMTVPLGTRIAGFEKPSPTFGYPGNAEDTGSNKRQRSSTSKKQQPSGATAMGVEEDDQDAASSSNSDAEPKRPTSAPIWNLDGESRQQTELDHLLMKRELMERERDRFLMRSSQIVS